jgi:hypothetical protein
MATITPTPAKTVAVGDIITNSIGASVATKQVVTTVTSTPNAANKNVFTISTATTTVVANEDALTVLDRDTLGRTYWVVGSNIKS